MYIINKCTGTSLYALPIETYWYMCYNCYNINKIREAENPKPQKGKRNMKLFRCIVDDGENVFKTLTAAKSKKELLEVYGGNGTFEKIEDVTNEYFTEKSVECLAESLRRTNWGEDETTIICALLEQHIKGLKR